MDVELKWHEKPTTQDQFDPRRGGMSHYLVDPGGLVLASVVPCDIHLGLWSVRTYVPLSRWVGYTIDAAAGRRLAELARTDRHPISRKGSRDRDRTPIDPHLPPKTCARCGKVAGDRLWCFDCERVQAPVVDVTPDPNLSRPQRCTCVLLHRSRLDDLGRKICSSCGGLR